VIEVIDALRDLFLEVDPDVSVDDSCSQPNDFEDGKLYAWEESSSLSAFETGSGTYREDFEIVFVYTRDNEGEVATGERSRAVSEALDEKRQAWLAKLVERRSEQALWAHISASTDADMIRQLGLRGLGIHVIGYRMLSV